MTDNEYMKLWQYLNNNFMRAGADRDTPLIVQFAHAVRDAATKASAPAKDTYTVEVNTCQCHPETCACNDWRVVTKGGRKVSTHYLKEDAERMAAALNGK
jgi:hypothetical protein